MSQRVYIEVIALFTLNGTIKPLEVIWKDGRRFEVQKIIDARRAPSLKAGSGGIRYTCKIEGEQRYLYLEDVMPYSAIHAKWFVEGRE